MPTLTSKNPNVGVMTNPGETKLNKKSKLQKSFFSEFAIVYMPTASPVLCLKPLPVCVIARPEKRLPSPNKALCEHITAVKAIKCHLMKFYQT